MKSAIYILSAAAVGLAIYAFNGNNLATKQKATYNRVTETATKKINTQLSDITALSNMLKNVEEGINEIYADYSIIQQTNAELPIYDSEQLMFKIMGLQLIMDNNRTEIANLKNRIRAVKSKDANINQIKANFIKILDNKNVQIEVLSKETLKLKIELQQRNDIIENKSAIITKQKKELTNQKAQIELFNQKHIILVSRKNTIHKTLTGNTVSIPSKLNRVEVLSQHSANSFRLQSDGRRDAKLIITDTASFWGESNYVIIKVRKIN